MIRDHTRATIVMLACGTAMLSAGCVTLVAPPPINITEYELVCGNADGSYPDRTVLLHNLQRTLDPNLAEDARLSSFSLVEQLGEASQEVLICMAFVMEDKGVPVELRRRVADYLVLRHRRSTVSIPVSIRDKTLSVIGGQ